jgi:hypothetical protein
LGGGKVEALALKAAAESRIAFSIDVAFTSDIRAMLLLERRSSSGFSAARTPGIESSEIKIPVASSSFSRAKHLISSNLQR